MNDLVPSRDNAFADNQVGWYIPKYDISVVVSLSVEGDRLKIEMNFDKAVPPEAQVEIETAVQAALTKQLFDGEKI